MINFRYHVVSLVAVFIALAVGIVLGAGPLKEPIGSTLADQVDSLRSDKDNLRAQLDAAAGRQEYANSAFEALAPQALEGLLEGQKVALVTIGPLLEDRVAALGAGIDSAGATLSARIHMEDEYFTGEPGPRRDLARKMEPLLESVEVNEGGDRAVIARGLAAALGPLPKDSAKDSAEELTLPGNSASPPPSPTPTPTPDPAAVWSVLEESGLVTGFSEGDSTLVVVLAGPYHQDPAAIKSSGIAVSRNEACVGVVQALVKASLPTVVSGPDQAEEDLVHRIGRLEELAATVSTVSSPLPDGEAIAALWAGAGELLGHHGKYGLGADLPPLPPYRPAPVEEPSSTDPSDGPSVNAIGVGSAAAEGT
ncbi:MAG: copper transporter [Bifidobacteriaceae bacterium]|jgi:hypothetical protein|nr:copper transporter [Bifidobacteriaceae bacterium]